MEMASSSHLSSTGSPTTMKAVCKCVDGTTREVELELSANLIPTDVYDVCENELDAHVDNVENLEDIMAEVQYIRESKEED
jgi:hypothetical protein